MIQVSDQGPKSHCVSVLAYMYIVLFCSITSHMAGGKNIPLQLTLPPPSPPQQLPGVLWNMGKEHLNSEEQGHKG